VTEEWERWRGTIDSDIVAIKNSLGTINSTCLGCKGNLNGQMDRVHHRIDDLSKQLSDLRVRVAVLAGGASIVGALVGTLAPRFFGQ